MHSADCECENQGGGSVSKYQPLPDLRTVRACPTRRPDEAYTGTAMCTEFDVGRRIPVMVKDENGNKKNMMLEIVEVLE